MTSGEIAKLNLKITQGAEFRQTLALIEDKRSPPKYRDLTGTTFLAEIRQLRDSPTITATFTINIDSPVAVGSLGVDANSGENFIFVDADDIRSIRVGHELELDDGINTFLTGQVIKIDFETCKVTFKNNLDNNFLIVTPTVINSIRNGQVTMVLPESVVNTLDFAGEFFFWNLLRIESGSDPVPELEGKVELLGFISKQ